MDPKLIVIFGRLWYDEKNGNTYHDTEILVVQKDEGIIHHRTDADYGYGDAWVSTAAEWLEKLNYIKLETYTNGSRQTLFSYCHDHGIKLFDSKAFVASRSELKGMRV